ncbi:MAG TPA: peptide-methionine (S)-S-oxide reductase MsrA [Gemmatimonadaceae bacterium]|nr:peptide-methionine (S)-S-oxide reductase MsrA [Gemmatimonadaceae bacterium]
MIRSVLRGIGVFGVALAAVAMLAGRSSSAATMIPAADVGAGLAPAAGEAVAIFSGGCFWGVQAVFQHMKGVKSAISGYTGGSLRNPGYEQVSTGTTGHAESVRITFDPSQVSYADLLRVFFSVATDPTELNYQGPDHGTQYRSVIWYTTPEQQRAAKAYIEQLTKAKVYQNKIVTEVKPAQPFYNAEAYHQDYATLHPDDRYIAYNDAPKVENFKKLLPSLYRDQPVLVGSAQQ